MNRTKPAEPVEKPVQEALQDETTSRPKRKIRTLAFQVVLFSAIGAFAILTLIVSSTPLLAIDIQITSIVQSIPFSFFATAMNLVSWVGFQPQSYIIPAVVALTLFRMGLHWEAVTSVVAALLPGLVNVLVKDLIRRPRPTSDLVDVFSVLDSYSFPSGHVMFYAGFFGFLWFVVFTIFKRSPQRTLLLTLFASLIALVGVSRIYLGHHWASDILGAYLLGGVTLELIFQFYRWGKKRFFTRQPAAPG